MFLPANSGPGRCALALNNFLIALHNDFIGRCKSLLKDESRYVLYTGPGLVSHGFIPNKSSRVISSDGNLVNLSSNTLCYLFYSLIQFKGLV